MRGDRPPFLLVRRGNPSYNEEYSRWAEGLPRKERVREGIRTAVIGYVGALYAGIGLLRGNKANMRYALRHGLSVAIWTPPGEWRVARTLVDLAQIIADGGEVDPPKDED